MPAHRFQLLIQAPQLVVHPVDVRRESPQLISIGHVDMGCEIARRDGLHPSFDPPDRVDHRPGQQQAEHQSQHDASHGRPDKEPLRGVERTAVLGDQRVGVGLGSIHQLGGEIAEPGRAGQTDSRGIKCLGTGRADQSPRHCLA